MPDHNHVKEQLFRPAKRFLRYSAAEAAATIITRLEGLTHGQATTLGVSRVLQFAHALTYSAAGDALQAYEVAREAVQTQSPLFPRDLLCYMLRWTAAAGERVGEAREARQWTADAVKIERQGAESLSMLKLLQPARRHTSELKLSDDERDALTLTASGYTLTQTGAKLKCASAKVRRLLASAREKYACANTSSLIARALESGEISIGKPTEPSFTANTDKLDA